MATTPAASFAFAQTQRGKAGRSTLCNYVNGHVKTTTLSGAEGGSATAEAGPVPSSLNAPPRTGQTRAATWDLRRGVPAHVPQVRDLFGLYPDASSSGAGGVRAPGKSCVCRTLPLASIQESASPRALTLEQNLLCAAGSIPGKCARDCNLSEGCPVGVREGLLKCILPKDCVGCP